VGDVPICESGADKVSINTSAVLNPQLVADAAAVTARSHCGGDHGSKSNRTDGSIYPRRAQGNGAGRGRVGRKMQELARERFC